MLLSSDPDNPKNEKLMIKFLHDFDIPHYLSDVLILVAPITTIFERSAKRETIEGRSGDFIAYLKIKLHVRISEISMLCTA